MVISSHGARVVDGTQAAIEVLLAVVDAVGKRVAVIVDNGFRRDSDVVKAMAPGTSAVFIGRATLYDTAVGGGVGVARAITLFTEEVDRVLALRGRPGIAGLNRDFVVLPPAMQRDGADSRKS